MSKSLRSMSEYERSAAISRRLKSESKGLGYWAAVDAQKRRGEIQTKEEKKGEQA